MANFLVGVEEQGLGLDYADTFEARVAQVRAEDVRRVAGRYLVPDYLLPDWDLDIEAGARKE